MKEKHIDHPEMLAFGVTGVQIACIHFTARLTGFLKAGSKVCLTGMDPENEKKKRKKENHTLWAYPFWLRVQWYI